MKSRTPDPSSHPLYRPLYIKGNVSFSIDNHDLIYARKELSVFGVAGLPWHPLKPKLHFGQKVTAFIQLTQHPEFKMVAHAHINREITTHSQYMGLRFHLDAKQRSRLEDMIGYHGHLPAQNYRKYPRVPFLEWVDSFPARALLYPRPSLAEVPVTPIATSVTNLSPEGLLISTENPGSHELKPGQRVSVVIEPRGGNAPPIRVQTSIRRLFDDLSLTSGNPIRSFGLQFVAFEPGNERAYRELLKKIVTQIQARAKTSPKPG